MSATLHGTITFWAGAPEANNLVIRFFTPGTDTEVHKSASVSDSSGDFYVYDAPVGTYDVGVKSLDSLSRLVASQIFTDGETTTIDFGESALGDLNRDDYITAADLSILNGAYYGEGGDCYGYAGNWLLPTCPVPPPPGGACYGYIIS